MPAMSETPCSVYLVLTTYFPTSTSWRCAYVYDQVRTIQSLRPEMRVVVVNLDAAEDYRYGGILVWGGFRRFSFSGSGLFPHGLAFANARRLRACLRAHGLAFERVRVVHAHLPSVGALAVVGRRMFPNAKVLVQYHHSDPSSVLGLGTLASVMCYRFYRRVLGQADCVVSISDFVTRMILGFPRNPPARHYPPVERSRRILRWFAPARPKRVLRLHNGVDTAQFRPGAGGYAHGGGFVLGCIANFIDSKDQMTLLRALVEVGAQLGDWRLRLIGSGPMLPTCRAYVAEHNLQERVSFETEVDHSRLPDFYRSLDLFVLPSFFEAFGCVFTEAWACGTPFVTCEGGGMDDMILPKERHLWLCRPRDPRDLSEKILYYYRNRPTQHMAGPVDINVLVAHFLEQIGV